MCRSMYIRRSFNRKMKVTLHLMIVGLCLHISIVLGKLPMELDNTVQAVNKTRINDHLVRYMELRKTRTETKLSGDVMNLMKELIELTDYSASITGSESILHPVNFYRFVRNHTVIYRSTVARLREADETFDVAILDESKESFPTFEEYAYITTAILNLQEMYNISANDGSRGDLFTNKLTAQECRDFSQIAYITGRHYLSRQWRVEGLRLLMEQNDTTDILEQALDDASLFAFVTGNVREALNITQFILEKFPANENAQSLHGQITLSMSLVYDMMTDERKAETDRIGHIPPSLLGHTQRQRRLCQQTYTSYKGRPDLYCEYDFFHGENGFLNWNPLQIEIISPKFHIVKIHKVFSKRTINFIKQAAKPKVLGLCEKTSTAPETLSLAMEGLKLKHRHASVFDKDLPQTLVKRLTSLFGSAIHDENPLQVTNYAIGGDIEHSSDTLHVSQMNDGRNIIKAVMYLSSAEAGGATIFPEAGLTVYPETGSMLAWQEVTRGDLTNEVVTNRECPVIIGDKWTATFRAFL